MTIIEGNQRISPFSSIDGDRNSLVHWTHNGKQGEDEALQPLRDFHSHTDGKTISLTDLKRFDYEWLHCGAAMMAFCYFLAAPDLVPETKAVFEEAYRKDKPFETYNDIITKISTEMAARNPAAKVVDLMALLQENGG